MTSSTSTPHSHLETYQAQIDGIRAIAVLGVILYHANPEWLKGGFFGVDVFFVISGYLISGLILNQHQNGDFSLVQFYIKRLRRIMPALLVVISISFVVCWIILLPDEMRDFSKTIFSSVLMYSNILFITDTGYFDTQTSLKPLLHTWSLSIEAQFYLIFPILFLCILKFTKNPIFTISTLFLISFFYADHSSTLDSERSFFQFSSRAWELLAGCLGLLAKPKFKSLDFNYIEFLSLCGLGLILYVFFGLDNTLLHPGKVTLLSILGTILLILFGTKDTLVGKLLTSNIMIFIGLISYSLYLWHQPIISLAKTQLEQLNVFYWLSLFSLIFLLSILTWQFVEKPFRSQSFISTSKFIPISFASSLMLCIIGLVGYHNYGYMNQRFSKEKIQLLKDLDNGRYKDFLFNNLYGNEILTIKFTDQNKPKMLIVGDSFAADLMNMITVNHYLKNFEVRTLYIPARCQFYLGDDNYLNFIDKKDTDLCKYSQQKLAILKNNINEFDQVIFAFQWKKWVADHLNKSISALHLKNNKKLIFLGSKGFSVNKRMIIKSNFRNISTLTSARLNSVKEINKIIALQTINHYFIDQDEIFCGVNNQCRLFTNDARPITVDGGHLTPEGAFFLGKQLFSHPILLNLEN